MLVRVSIFFTVMVGAVETFLSELTAFVLGHLKSNKVTPEDKAVNIVSKKTDSCYDFFFFCFLCILM